MTTSDYAELQELTVTQRNAVDCLVLGKNDTQTAETVGVHRVTVTKWRLNHPAFQAELSHRRTELWDSLRERFLALAGRAFEVIEEELGGTHKQRVAIELLKIGRLSEAIKPPIESKSAKQLIGSLIEARVAQKQDERRKFMSLADLQMRELNGGDALRIEYLEDKSTAEAEILAEIRESLQSSDIQDKDA